MRRRATAAWAAAGILVLTGWGAASSAEPLPDLDERQCAPGMENYHLRGNYLKERHDEGYCGQDLVDRERRPRGDRRG